MTQPIFDFDVYQVPRDDRTVYAVHRADVQAEAQRTTAIMWRLLAFLEARGSQGATNGELAEKFGIRFSGRVSDLRCKHGYQIDADPIKGGLWRYRLIGDPR